MAPTSVAHHPRGASFTMPTVLRVNGFRFFFFSNEGGEPAHVHVEREDSYAKFWLNPVALEASSGFRSDELSSSSAPDCSTQPSP